MSESVSETDSPSLTVLLSDNHTFTHITSLIYYDEWAGSRKNRCLTAENTIRAGQVNMRNGLKLDRGE